MSSIPVMQKANSKSESPSHHFHLLTSGETRSINAALEAEDRAFMERKAAKVAARLSQVEAVTKEVLTASPHSTLHGLVDKTKPQTGRQQGSNDSTIKFSALRSSDRIRKLNEMDSRIPVLLQSVSEAIGALVPGSSGTTQVSLAGQQAAFKAASSAYFKTLSEIDRELRRQIYALEAAGIIPAEITKQAPASGFKPSLAQNMFSKRPNPMGASADDDAETITPAAPLAGGMGNLDIGWLNSRNGLVEKEMEAELWAQAEDLVRSAEDIDKEMDVKMMMD